MKKTKYTLFHSVIALILCASMFVGTTFAWFTDSVSSHKNLIVAGNLDVGLEYMDANGKWWPVKDDTNVFAEGARWEPGHTEVVYLRVSNKGSLALKYQLGVNVYDEKTGTNKDGGTIKLSEHIRMGAVKDVKTAYATREDARKAVGNAGTLASGYVTYGQMTPGAGEQYVALVVYMPEEVDNVANYMTGTEPPEIYLGIHLYATQMANENDSFGPNYDLDAKHPLGDVNFTASESVEGKVDASGVLTEPVTVGNENGEIYANLPADVKLEEGAEGVGLVVQSQTHSEAEIEVNDGESVTPFHADIPGLSPDNDVPVVVTMKGILRKGLNRSSVSMYHVEDGVTVPMTYAATLADVDEHNEFYYDPATGDVTMAVKSFSEFDVKTDDKNLWEGSFDTSWYNTTDTEFTLYTEDQLAGFGKIVDGTADGIKADTFAGKTVKLGRDLNLEAYDDDGNRISFNPIGCGYVSGVTNSGSKDGRAFMGTFDGQNHYIYNLYQNGWDIGLEYCNLGGGLFASIANGTVQNLTISGANIVMECVEQGVLVGLSQGNCTYVNIKIYNSKVANYQRATGGLIGEVSAMPDGDNVVTISDVVIGPDVVVGSLWGDFDAPVGGVIGARWDDSNATTIKMTNVDVAARLDVYNDVTSSYQWYAYRRAGMLIGNTEQTAEDNSHLAAATFLECTNVKVYYGDWVNYHYCEFSNANPSWPFVRVEAGENCSAFSNPRWGIATNTKGEKVTPENHSKEDHTFHEDGDDCYVELPFNQLYGGGQGVYGAVDHMNAVDGADNDVVVHHYLYTISYVDNDNVLGSLPVTEAMLNSDGTYTVEQTFNFTDTNEKKFEGWLNAGSTIVTQIRKNNDENIILYPKWAGEYTIRFLNNHGDILYYEFFKASSGYTTKLSDAGQEVINSILESLNTEVGTDYVVTWDEATGFTSATYVIKGGADVVVKPVYTYNGNLRLSPIDTDGDGETNYYQVDGLKITVDEYNKLDQEAKNAYMHVHIPDDILGVPVTHVNTNALSEFADLNTIYLPKDITYIGQDAFVKKNGHEQITIVFQGTKAQWKALEKTFHSKWDNYVGTGSKIICSDGNLERKGWNGVISEWFDE